MARSMKTMDGNTAAAHVSYAFTDVAAIYPITPSSPMADYTDQWATQGRKNIFGHEVIMSEMQSEGGAAGAVHGSLQAGALTTTYTASQGLLLMLPNMYKIAGELLPTVFHVSARALASHALSIFGDHSDVYACRQSGFAMLCANSVQEVMDLGAVAHLSTIESRVPFLHFFDGFRTSHEIQKIEAWDYDDLKDMCNMEAVAAFRNKSLNPNRPLQRGTAQNPDIFFQAREASNRFYDVVPEVVQNYMDKVNVKIGTNYKLFNYYGAEDADRVIIAMGSVCETIDETIDYMNANGHKVGVVKVRLYRPFSAKHLIAALPETVKNIIVLDRTKEPGSLGEPLYLDVVASLRGTKFENCLVTTGRYGLGSKDTTPAQIIAAYKNTEKPRFTIGIKDDVTHLSLDITENPSTAPAGTTSCKFWGLGADGTVGANKNSVKIIGDHTDKYAQAYFDYDSKKSGGVTISHLRFGDKKINSTYLINKADFVACHNPSYVRKYDMVQDIKDGGTFLLNCPWDVNELSERLPGQAKKYIAEHNIKLYTIDGIKIGKEIGLGGRINTVLQAAFFKLANIIPIEDAVEYMKAAAKASYQKKGDDVVQMNYNAIDAGVSGIVEIQIPEDWKNAEAEDISAKAGEGLENVVHYVNTIQNKINAQAGNTLPVSAFVEYADGTTPSGSAAFEKRGIAVEVPTWNKDTCLQCNLCSYVCPHAAIRPAVMDEEEAAKAPDSMKMVDMKGMPGKKFAVTVSVLDCTGCGSCVNVCPEVKGNKTLSLSALDTQLVEQKSFDYGRTLELHEDVLAKFNAVTPKGSQFRQPYLEFSGACAGCGETPYAKLITQMFGDRMYIANATGCSSIWGGSSPANPYTVDKRGRGPAWANSLFEDNAEYGYGMALGTEALRMRVIDNAEKLIEKVDADTKEVIQKYLDTRKSSGENTEAARRMVQALSACGVEAEEKDYILANADFAGKKSQWIFGGDGWAYDIGYGGLDHVLASNRDVNVFVFDTEVYSNTGGQASKSTPTGAVAQFAAGGKEVRKKNLAEIAMGYGYIYVAMVAMGADYNQCVKAIAEAEAYPGPSLIIGYAPCIAHGIKGGMRVSMTQEKKAVQSGYWSLFRYNPLLAEEGKNPFTMDSKEPTLTYREFIETEVRYNRLLRSNPEKAEELFKRSEAEAKFRRETFKRRTMWNVEE
ncbi:MAG: pyruvate:ferredoxin (flavodoxin) oxidoreductase [Catonella sp.]|uniref:pyruvate:ferredoxin (flavodoxin) oxidoreductase n=1 Tax=Catonella sp. TaxID=2382125 RepID=UPI003FA1860F